MLYGEVFADDIDPACGIEGHPECTVGKLVYFWFNWNCLCLSVRACVCERYF